MKMHRLFFDIESTGPNANKDRIVQLAIIVVDEDGTVLLSKSKLYNPGIPITGEATKIHGITDEMVKDAPHFRDDAKRLKKIFEGKVIITYNGMRFDIPMLMAEFDRAKVEVELSGKFIDTMKVEAKLSPRDLSSVYKKYTGKYLDGAHDALADVKATQIVYEHHSETLYNAVEQADGAGADVTPDDWDIDKQMLEMSGSTDLLDYSGKLKRDEQGYLIFNFGKKCMGKRVIDNKDYASWILSEEFPNQVKKLIREELNKTVQTKKKTQPTYTNAISGDEPDDDLPF
jgi:DNA polymerase-3 subunit epsilon